MLAISLLTSPESGNFQDFWVFYGEDLAKSIFQQSPKNAHQNENIIYFQG